MKKVKKIKLFLILFLSCIYAKTQSFNEIPEIKSYKLVAKSNNGGPSGIANGDKFGRSVASIGDIDNDGINDVAIGANEDANSGTLRGSVWICFMNTDGTVKSSPAPVEITGNSLGGASNDYFGTGVAGLGDINGDGYEDIAVGAPGYDLASPQTTDCGAVYIIFLNTSAGVVSYERITKGSTGFGSSLAASSTFGSSVANLGDINNDGKNDIAVGCSSHDSNQGGVFTIKLKSDGKIKAYYEIKEGVTNFSSSTLLDAGDNFGWSVAGPGDLNYNGKEDLIVGAKGDDDGYTDAGAFWIMYLDTSGAVTSYKKLSYPLMTNYYWPNTSTVALGESVNTTDINGDGLTDLMVGVRSFNSSKGGFYFMTLDSAQNIKSIKLNSFNYSWSYGGPSTAPQFGIDLCEINLGNTNHKTYIVGGNFHNQSGANQGSFYTITMDSLKYNYPGGATILDYSKFNNNSGNFTGSLADQDFFGIDMAAIGDLNDDGYNDYVVGAHGNDDGFSGGGAAWVLFIDANNRVSSSNEIRSGSTNFATLGTNHNLGWGLAPAGDFDNDGVEDVFIGSPGDDQGGGDRGAVYLTYLNTNGTVKGYTKIANTAGKLDLLDTDQFGVDIDTIGDLDNNGVVDIVVGAYRNDDGGTAGTSSNRGAVYVVFLKSDGSVKKSKRISDTQGNFSETFANGDGFGIAVAGIGDVNGDGKVDIAVGSNMNTTGAVHIITLDTNGACVTYKKINNSGSNFPYTLTNSQGFGASLDMIPDQDGNGINDLIIGQSGKGVYGLSRGIFWVASYDSLGSVVSAKVLSDSVGNFYTNTNASYTLGQSIEYGGTDANGNLKIAFGGRDDDGGTDRGAAFVSTTLSAASFIAYNPIPYANLLKELDGGFFQAYAILYFIFNEKYNDSDSQLKYKIRNELNSVVYSNTAHAESSFHGKNLYGINLVCDGANLASGYYLLEVTNEKEESQYLRFKFVRNTNCK